MNKKQKAIIIVFAIIDIAIVAFLARTILKTWSSYPVNMIQSTQSSCSAYYLDALQTGSEQITISLKENIIYITVSHFKNENFDDSELLWSLLDQLRQNASNAKNYCPKLQTMIIQHRISQKNVTNNHISVISVDDLYSWSNGILSEDEFSATIRYRQSTTIPE